MPGRVSAANDLQTAIDTVFTGDAQLGALIDDRIFSIGTVPKDAVAPLIELGESREGAWMMFAKGGNENVETMTIVSPRKLGKPGVLAIFAHVVRLLDRQRITVAGHTVAIASVDLITVFPDPNGDELRGVVEYRVRSLNA